MSASPERESPHRSDRKPLAWLAGSFEVAASLMAVYAIGALLINKVDTMVAFFGETPTVTSDNVSTYHRWLLRLAIAVAITLIAALWRKGLTRRGLCWPGLVLLSGLLAAMVFQVSTPTPGPVPLQDRRGPACLSGGDNNECVGG